MVAKGLARDIWQLLRRSSHLRFSFVMVCCGGGLFSSIYILYGLPIEAVLYAWIMVVFLGLIGFAYQFWKLSVARTQLGQIKGGSELLTALLPRTQDPLEQCYQELIVKLDTITRQMATQYDVALTERIDSNAQWVHQIKTPIAALDLMLQTQGDSESKRAMQLELFKIEQYVDMALHLVRLDSGSRAGCGDGGTSDLQLGRYKVYPLVTAVVKKYKSLFIHKRIGLVLEIDEEAELLTDEKWLSMILEQLLSNALKYTQTGQIGIKLEGSNSLTIEDTGIGIDPQDLPRVFEKGFTGYNGRMDKRATGIGLYLTKRACDKVGIGVSVESEIGKGTVVRLSFNGHKEF